jgi:hypothetical protein
MTEKWPALRAVIEVFGWARCLSRGQRHVAKGRYDQAVADFDRAIELNPTEDAFAAARTEIRELTGRTDADDALPSDRGTEAT